MTRRIIFTAVLFIIVSGLSFFFLTIKNSKDCSQIVIDTYEIHSKIDIPEVDHVNCYFDEKRNTRISIYNLKGHINIDGFDYVHTIKDELKGMDLLSIEEKPSNPSIYVASGERFGRSWTYVVDQRANRLWAELNY